MIVRREAAVEMRPARPGFLHALVELSGDVPHGIDVTPSGVNLGRAVSSPAPS